jgi:hypothetical protein
MSFEAEWAQIKQEASSGPVLALAHADAGAAGGEGGPDVAGGDLGVASSMAAWKAAAQGVGVLAGTLAKAGHTLLVAHQGMDTSLTFHDSTFATLTAQDELHATWSGYLQSLLGRCDALKGQLTAAGAALCVSDKVIEADFDKLDDGYTDTSAVGGQS